MKGFNHLLFMIFMIKITHQMFYSDVSQKMMSFLEKTAQEDYKRMLTQKPWTSKGVPVAGKKSRKWSDYDPRMAMRGIKSRSTDQLNEQNGQKPNEHFTNQAYRKDPVLNYLKRRNTKGLEEFRRKYYDGSTSEVSSSSLEIKDWKKEWQEIWIQKKYEAINSSLPKGDVVNMVAARPWGVPCGDPDQHDAPWGSCTLPMECEAEYRIYRGDYFCGRTQFVCCAVQQTTYDMYGAFDASFADSDLSSDSEEKKYREKDTKDKKFKRDERKKRKRRNERTKRKRKIKRNIRKIVREIRKILNKAYRNGTTARKRKTKELKKFIKSLKKKYKKDRSSIKDIHELEMIHLDSILQKNLDKVRDINQQYITNSTFRDFIANGSLSKSAARTLMSKYPQLKNFLDARRFGRADETVMESEDDERNAKEFLNYDLEYGLLYY